MPDLHDLLERRARRYEPPADLLDRVLDRRRRRDRNRRIGAAVVALAVVAATFAGLSRALTSGPGPQPAGQPTPTTTESAPPETVTGETNGTYNGPCLDSQDGPPPWVCLGPLDEGTYTSQRFEPALTFTVPAGWMNPWDTRGAFELWAPGWSEGPYGSDPDVAEAVGGYLFDHPGLSVRRDPRPDEGCSPHADATEVGTSALEVAAWVADHPAIAMEAPSPVEVAGLTGYLLDVSLADTWRESCPGGPAAVWLFEDLYLRDQKIPEFATMRLILLDLPDGGSVLIAIDGTQVDAAMPVVRSFEFDLD